MRRRKGIAERLRIAVVLSRLKRRVHVLSNLAWDSARVIALLCHADHLILRIDIRLLKRGCARCRSLRCLEQPLRVIFLELRIRINRSRSAAQAASRHRELQVTRVDSFLVVDLTGVVIGQVLVVLRILVRAVRVRVRRIDLINRILNLCLLLLIVCVGCISSAITSTDDDSPTTRDYSMSYPRKYDSICAIGAVSVE